MTTAELQVHFASGGGGPFVVIKPDTKDGEEFGRFDTVDPTGTLIEPPFTSRDIRDIAMLGLTAPNEDMIKKNSAIAKQLPPINLVRLDSGKGMILLASRATFWGNRGPASIKPVPIKEELDVQSRYLMVRF